MNLQELRKAYIKLRVYNMMAFDNDIITITDKVEREHGVALFIDFMGINIKELNVSVNDITNAYIEARKNNNLNGYLNITVDDISNASIETKHNNNLNG